MDDETDIVMRGCKPDDHDFKPKRTLEDQRAGSIDADVKAVYCRKCGVVADLAVAPT